MTVADKLVYLSDTKNILAEAINSYTQVITPDTPFREYAQWIDNIVFSAEGGIPSLFDGEAGFVWSGLPYYQDPAGTTVASWGNPVGLISDDSGNGADFTQPTVTARPVLGRVPVGGRRNFLTWTEDLSQAAWAKTNVTVVPAPAPDGTMSASRLVVNSGTTGTEITRVYQVGTTIPSGDRRYQLVAKADGCRYVTFGRFGNSFNYALAQFDLISGAVVSYRVSGDSYSESTPPTITDSGDGWYTCDMGLSSTANVSIQLGVVPSNVERGTPTFDNTQYEIGNGVDGVLIWHPQAELGNDATPYQRVGATVYDITESGVPDVHYLYFDGADDSVSTTLPTIENGTLVLAGTNGIWIDDDFNHAGGTFAIGPTSYTDGPSGILGAVGDLIVGGSFVIDRQLTAEERTLVVNKLKSMGAPGVFELGPELVGDPGYDDPEYWAISGSVEILNSRAIFTESPTGTYTRTSGNLLTTGVTYLLTASVITASSYGNLRLQVGSGTSVSFGPSIVSPGIHRAVLTLGEGSDRSAGPIVGSGPKSAELESFSVRKLELIP